MKVFVGGHYVYNPVGYDMFDPKTKLLAGTVVKVINVYGCPKANTMGHCYVGDVKTGKFIGLVWTMSLTKLAKAKREKSTQSSLL